MLDFILGLYLAGLAVRGWLRGFVKELLDLAGLVLGVLLGFRLSEPVGNFFVDRFDVTPEWARIGAGIAIFVVIGTIVSIFAHYLGRFVQLPGLNLSNRLLGSGFAVAWGVFLILVFASIISLLPLPESVDQTIEESAVASAVAGEDAYARELFESAAGDDVISSLLALEPLIGSQRVILEDDEAAAIPPVPAEDLEVTPEEAEEILGFLNAARVTAGVAPLAPSLGLADVARAHALDMYFNGFVSHVSPTTGRVGDRVRAAGIQLTQVGENLALAASTRAVHDGFMDSDSHRENLLRSGWNRVGVAAVRGPYGLMVVQVFGG